MRFELLSKYFPPPRFLTPPLIGISFSDSNLKAVSFDEAHSKPELQSIILSLEKGAISAGKIVNMKEVVKKLTSMSELFSSKFIFFTLPDELVYIYQISIPIGKGGNVTESVAFTIEENVPLSLADTVFDFKPIEVTESDSEYQASMVVAACVKEQVERFGQAIRESGFEPVGCIHESQAIANAVIPKSFSDLACIVHARADRIGLYLVKDGVVRFSNYQTVSTADYRTQFSAEYEKFIEYSARYETGGEPALKEIFVCGEFEFTKKIVSVLSENTGRKQNAKLSNVWTNMLKIEETAPSINYEDSLVLAGPVGAILSGII